jgi:sulfate transport system permease protein
MTATARRQRNALVEPAPVRWLLIGATLLLLGVFLLLPLIVVFTQALKAGIAGYFSALSDSDTLSSIRLTLLTAAIAVPLNTLFGVAAAWAIAKFEFRGKSLLTTLIDLPFSVSPVIAGLVSSCCSASAAGSATGCQRRHQIIFAFRASCWRRCSSRSRSSRAN